MAVLNIEKSFLTENRSVLDFLNQSGQGLYIPLYQRDYSWDSDNIDQLLEDLSRGIQRIASGEVTDDSKEIRFLGTIITVVEPNRDHIYPVEIQAVPPRIERLIDGQQRVSTIALMAALLTKRLTEIKSKVKVSNPIYEQVKEICEIWVDQKLIKVFSFDLGRGKPKLKPKIIRGAKDYWTREDDVDVAYKSELANYLGHFIKAYDDKSTLPSLTKENNGNSLLYQNARRIESWLKKVVSTAHEGTNEDEFASADKILTTFTQEQIWEFERPELVSAVLERKYDDKKSDSYILSELVQVLSVCHYLLDRCCFTIIQPTDEDWAFDMFQSLNATGTPLTAIETFKPTVVTTVDNLSGQFKDSDSDISFKKVESFLSEATTAQQKNKRTNDFLTSFFVSFDGRTMSTHFSYQRKVLDGVYGQCGSLVDKEAFISDMGNYAEFYQKWLKFNESDYSFPLIDCTEASFISMLILFLKSSNHKMAITVLAKSYDAVIKQKGNAVSDFSNVVKAIAAFYFLWRSSYSNSGLDSTYRDFFKLKNEVTPESIKAFFAKVLTNKGIGTKDKWIERAKDYCRYDITGRDVIRFALFVASHDTIPDNSNPGLMKEGREGCSTYLSREKWIDSSLKTIEHVAPQTNRDNQWDVALYDQHLPAVQSLGNLTLLPQDLNSSAGNKGWPEKLLYYKSVSENDPEVLQNITQLSRQLGIDLNIETQLLLQDASYNNHLSPISQLGVDTSWNKELVEKRTERMLSLIWDRVSLWLFAE